MKFSLNRILSIGLLLFLAVCSIGNVMIQVAVILSFGLILLFAKGINKSSSFNIFYLALLVISLVQVLFFFRDDYSIPYVVNSLLIAFMWGLAYLAHNFIIISVTYCTKSSLEKILVYFFNANVFLVVVQYVLVSIQAESIFPFSVPQFGMSTGDYLKGFFSNSSVNMVVMSFFAVYFFTKKEKTKTIIAIIIAVLTTYMSGILIALAMLCIHAFFLFNLKNKFRVIVFIILGIYSFSIISPENIEYIEHIFTEKINSKTDPPRKLVSFKQTAANFVSSPSSFFLGEGGGKFSSRTAYLTGGEYVNWYPEKLVYRSEKFEDNHFKLWNYEALRIAFRDGTANQPFSFYNKIIGEYGLVGLCLFIIYISYFFNRYRCLTYGRLILPLVLGFLTLDYWFEYFAVMLFFELFMLLDLKRSAHSEVAHKDHKQ